MTIVKTLSLISELLVFDISHLSFRCVCVAHACVPFIQRFLNFGVASNHVVYSIPPISFKFIYYISCTFNDNIIDTYIMHNKFALVDPDAMEVSDYLFIYFLQFVFGTENKGENSGTDFAPNHAFVIVSVSLFPLHIANYISFLLLDLLILIKMYFIFLVLIAK